jgi:tRNA-splicing ligase RtcB
MGTSSYICKGTETAMRKTFGSTVHGAGRAMSRHAAIKKFWGGKIKEDLAKKGIVAQATHPKVLAEESPDAYKNVLDVVDSVHGAGVSPKVVKLSPIGVLKG